MLVFIWYLYAINTSIAAGNGIAFNVRSNLEFFDHWMESIFIEMEKTKCVTFNLVTGFSYQMPDLKLDFLKLETLWPTVSTETIIKHRNRVCPCLDTKYIWILFNPLLFLHGNNPSIYLGRCFLFNGEIMSYFWSFIFWIIDIRF